MTDYAKPVTAAEVLIRAALDLRGRASRLNQDASYLQARADELEMAANDLEREARMYEQWQPKPEAEAS